MDFKNSNTALVVIDMQDGILFGEKPLVPHAPKELLTKTNHLIEEAIKAEAPTALINVSSDRIPVAMREKFTNLSLRDDLVAHENSMSFTKYEPSAFSIVALQNFLKKDIENVLLTGIVTETGVLKTAEDLVAAGFNVITIEDLTSARTSENHQHALERLDTIGDVISLDQVIAYLQ
ncbi:cysteine hydrolase [Periweissella cryptocerci]|uniref:Cysteine hydrolase n=1 Tax=Periweissella cryptocerci TaxID=2506420 RepID=A0A4P6YVM5_9LACO|nr:cysteine hydrolase [Periweissella cryptocerci]QBO36850.1 cysteine hydrolase [Periweissella cryptocerci]